jgi:hypothetical protein
MTWSATTCHRAIHAERLYRSFNGRMRDELLNDSLFLDLPGGHADHLCRKWPSRSLLCTP